MKTQPNTTQMEWYPFKNLDPWPRYQGFKMMGLSFSTPHTPEITKLNCTGIEDAQNRFLKEQNEKYAVGVFDFQTNCLTISDIGRLCCSDETPFKADPNCCVMMFGKAQFISETNWNIFEMNNMKMTGGDIEIKNTMCNQLDQIRELTKGLNPMMNSNALMWSWGYCGTANYKNLLEVHSLVPHVGRHLYLCAEGFGEATVIPKTFCCNRCSITVHTCAAQWFLCIATFATIGFCLSPKRCCTFCDQMWSHSCCCEWCCCEKWDHGCYKAH